MTPQKAQWARGPSAPSPPSSPRLTDASFPSDGHGPLLGCTLAGMAPVGSQTRFQSILGPYRQEEETVTSWPASVWRPGACPAVRPTCLPQTDRVP